MFLYVLVQSTACERGLGVQKEIDLTHPTNTERLNTQDSIDKEPGHARSYYSLSLISFALTFCFTAPPKALRQSSQPRASDRVAHQAVRRESSRAFSLPLAPVHWDDPATSSPFSKRPD